MQPPPAGAWPAGGQYMPPQPPKSGGISANAALVAAILLWPLGIIFGHIVRHRVKRTGEPGAGKALAALIIGYVWGVVAIILVVVAVSVVSAGFHNLSTLQSSVSQQLDANLHNPKHAGFSPSTNVTSVSCAHKSGTQYVCAVRLSSGSGFSLPVTVSSDGSHWHSNT